LPPTDATLRARQFDELCTWRGLLVVVTPCQLFLLSGPEYGRTVALLDTGSLETPRCTYLAVRLSPLHMMVSQASSGVEH
jgi:hypothetical protein